MNKFKLLGLTFLMIFSGSAIAQDSGDSSDSDSEIVMTRAELKSFLNKVAETRREQIQENRKTKNKLDLYRLRDEHRKSDKNKQNDEDNDYGRYQDVSRNELIRELDRLNYRVDQLSRDIYGGTKGGRDNSTIIIPGQSSNGYYPSNTPVQTPIQTPVNNDRILWDLQKELEAVRADQKKLLEANQLTPTTVDTKDDNASEIEARFEALEKRLAQAETPAERRDVLSDLLAKFKNFKKQVFFAHDSDKLSSEDAAYIKDVTEVLNKYPELSVVLEGWASPVGNKEYNKQLSMRRSESVESALINHGISEKRIVSSFKGEDTSTSDAQARRVDMSIILK